MPALPAAASDCATTVPLVPTSGATFASPRNIGGDDVGDHEGVRVAVTVRLGERVLLEVQLGVGVGVAE